MAIEEMIEIDVEFVQRFRNSVIIQIFSFLEVELKKFCYYHAKTNNKEFTIDDLKGGTELEKAKKYLKKCANIDITTDSANWQFIENIRKLRNKMVHQNSILETKDNDYNSLVTFSKGNFELKQLGLHGSEIILNDVNFIRKCLVEVQKFLKLTMNL